MILNIEDCFQCNNPRLFCRQKESGRKIRDDNIVNRSTLAEIDEVSIECESWKIDWKTWRTGQHLYVDGVSFYRHLWKISWKHCKLSTVYIIYFPQCSQNFQNRNLRVKYYFWNFGILTLWPSKWVHGPLEIYSFEHMNLFNHSKNVGQSWQKIQNLLKLFFFY